MNNNSLKYIPIILFSFFFISGILVYSDYGISWDEYQQRFIGIVNLNYIYNLIFGFPVHKSIPELNNFIDKDYGSIYEMFTVSLEFMLGITSIDINNAFDNFHNTYKFRHLINFLFYFISTIFFYKFLCLRFKNFYIGIIGSALLIISPRIFAESFYNSKDIVFMSSFIISLYFLTRYFYRPSYKNLIFFAFVVGLSFDIRIASIIFIPIFYVISLYKFMDLKSFLYKNLCFTIIFLLSSFLFFPYLWENPLRIIDVFKNMTSFRWNGNVLYEGSIYKASGLPSTYLLNFIIITTPPLIILFVLGGLAFLLKNNLSTSVISNVKSNLKIDNLFFIILASFILYTSVFKPVVYDGWRQFYFLYPLLIYFASYFIFNVSNIIQKKYYKSSILFLILFFCYSITYLYSNHPYQNVYFNFLAQQPIHKNYEVDYWGLINQDALKYIYNDTDKNYFKIHVLSFTDVMHAKRYLNHKKHFTFSKNIDDADYLIDNFRGNHSRIDKNYHNFELVKSFIIYDIKVMNIYRRKN